VYGGLAVKLPGPRRNLSARVPVPGSKSQTNRGLILAAAAGGGRVLRPLDCEDTRLLAAALDRAGWPLSWEADAITVGRRVPVPGPATLHLGNSGTGARLLLGLLSTVPGTWIVDGIPRLRERPMGPLLEALRGLGVPVEAAPGERLPAKIEGGPVAGGRMVLVPGPSSQFVSSLLLAAPRMEEGLELELAGPIPSRPYLELTRDALESFGAAVTVTGDFRRWRVAPGLAGGSVLEVEGDWSAAAFFVAAAAVAGGSVEIVGVAPDSSQGDRRILDAVAAAGCQISVSDGSVRVSGPVKRPVVADLSDTPDLFPALAVVAAVAPPGSRLTGLEHLRHKESDRLGVMGDNLRRLGAKLEIGKGSMGVVESLEPLEGPVEVVSAADHRIAMAMAVTALAVGELSLDDGGCVEKSFPEFWEVWERVAGP